MSTWLKGIKMGSKSFLTPTAFDDAVSGLKGLESGVKSIDDAFSSMPMTKEGDELVINGRRWRSSEPDFRMSNIRKVLDDMNVPNTVTSADEAVMKKINDVKVPEVDIKKMDDATDSARNFHSDLDVNAKTGSELEAKLDQKSKAKAESAYDKILKAVKIGGIATGIFFAVKITGSIWDDLNDMANQRNGCFISTKINGKVESCKLLTRSCGFPPDEPCTSNIANTIPYNIDLMLNNFVKSNDTSSLSEIEASCGIAVTENNIDAVLADEDNVICLSDYYDSKYTNTPSFDPCLAGDLEVGCIACNPSDVTSSPYYVDDTELPENQKISCVSNSTVLEALVDASLDMGLELFDSISGSISGSVDSNSGNFIMICGIILILFIIISVVMKFKPSPKVKPIAKVQ